MTSEPGKLTHRKPYQRQQSRWWWTRNPVFRRYMLREGTSIFVLLFSFELIYSLLQLNLGEAAWHNWLTLLAHPLFIAFNLSALVAALYHAATWFKLAPKIMVVRIGDWKLPEKTMLTGQWLGMLLVSIILIGLAIMAGGYHAN
jgi:fumarate reductase subunit C